MQAARAQARARALATTTPTAEAIRQPAQAPTERLAKSSFYDLSVLTVLVGQPLLLTRLWLRCLEFELVSLLQHEWFLLLLQPECELSSLVS